MTAYFLTVMAIAVVMLVRNQLVYRAQIRRIAEISAINKRELHRPDFYAVMDRRYAELDERSYTSMLLDLRCWTYRQFYPSEVV